MDFKELRSTLMLDSAPMAVNYFGIDRVISDCNLEAVRMFGFREKADYLTHFFLLMPPIQPSGRSSRELIREYLTEAYDQGYAKSEFVMQKIDGSLMYTEASFVRSEVEGNYVVTAYFRDLSDVFDAMEREGEAHETMHLFMNTSPVGMEIWDETLEIIDCNWQAFSMFGFADKNTFLTRVKDTWAGEHIVPEIFREALQSGFARYDGDFLRLDGTPLHCEVRLVRIMRKSRAQVIAYFLDISEVKRAIDKAREADKRAMLMLDATPLACFLVLENVTAIDCNLAAVELFGFANKTDAITRYREIFPAVSQDGKPLRVPTSLEWMNTSDVFRFEHNHISATGEYIPCEVVMVYLDYESSPVVACYYRDLREIKAMISDMKRIEVAEEESRAKSQFLARMSHEIRTPLNAIMGVCDIQLLKHHSPETEEAFMQMRASSDILLSIINDILDLSKVEAGKMEIHNKPYDVANLIFDTVQLNLMHVKEVQFNLHADEDLPATLLGDDLRVKQVLNNLLSNAFKYTQAGEVNLRFGIERGENSELANLKIELQDTGQGMTEAQLASLFESEYMRFNTQNNRLIQGTGLGMNITNSLIRAMNGTISAVSKVGEGSTFYVSLPQKIGSPEVIGQEVAENLRNYRKSQTAFRTRHKLEYTQMPNAKVLVVDDVESNLFVAKGLLLPYGLTVHTAVSGRECIEKIQEGNVYDIIFMDHMMPELDGIETAKLLREMGYREPIVALTANAILGQAELFVANGFAGLISKPIDAQRLNSYLMALIHNKHRTDAPGTAEKPKEPCSEELTAAFVRDAGQTIETLSTLLLRSDWHDVDYKVFTINTHGMKSALANIGNNQLSSVAAHLEQAGRSNSDDVIRRDAPIFLDDLREALREVSPKNDKKTSAAESAILLRSRLHTMKAACETYNRKEIRSALKKLLKHKWEPQTEDFLQEISADLLHSEFEKIAADIAKFLRE